MLEALSVLAGGSRRAFVPGTPHRLRAARTCYDHIAGTLGVSLHDRFTALRWCRSGSTPATITNSRPPAPRRSPRSASTSSRSGAPSSLRVRVRGLERAAAPSRRRVGRGAAERRAEAKMGGSGFDSRALSVTKAGRREMLTRFGLHD